MAAYGFCLQNNKYNSLRFKVWIDFNQDAAEREKALEAKKQAREKLKEEKAALKLAKKEKGEETDSEETEDDSSDDDGLDNRVKKSICLKMHALSEDVLAYFRVTLVQKFD